MQGGASKVVHENVIMNIMKKI
jgi:hypothetical protein